MQTPQALYQSKLCSPSDALQPLKDGDMIIVPTGVGVVTEYGVARLRGRAAANKLCVF